MMFRNQKRCKNNKHMNKQQRNELMMTSVTRVFMSLRLFVQIISVTAAHCRSASCWFSLQVLGSAAAARRSEAQRQKSVFEQMMFLVAEMMK